MGQENQGNEKKLKHLEFIQNAISRMGSNSFKIKGWYITVFTATIALAVDSGKWLYILVAYIPLFLFWSLDAYYLQQERRFRDIYDIVALEEESQINFDMRKGITPQCIGKMAFSKTIWPLYLIPGIILTIVVVIILVLLSIGVPVV